MNINNIAKKQEEQSNVVQLVAVNGKIQKQTKKYNKDGSIKLTHNNKVSGKDSEVYAFTKKEEIAAMIRVFDKHIEEAPDASKRQIAYRNKLLFLIGINVGIRGSDLRTLKWSFFFQDNGKERTFRDFYTLQPIKQRKQKKFVKLFFNQTVRKAILDYINKYPIGNLNDYLFTSRKGDKPIVVASLWRIIKITALEAGIKQNVGSHSLRKSFGYWCWHNAENKDEALVKLQFIFNHSSTQTTMRYIGLMDNEIEDMFNSIELGLDCIIDEEEVLSNE